MPNLNFDQSVIKILRVIRQQQGEKQFAFASALFVDRSTYSRLESGKGAISIGMLCELCKFLKLDYREIIALAEKSTFISELQLKQEVKLMLLSAKNKETQAN